MTVSKILHMQDTRLILKSLGAYFFGVSLIVLPYGIYLFVNGALIPYVDSVWTIVTRMQEVIDPHFVSVYPRNFPEAFVAMTNPGHTNFKHMTPSYLYIFILVYLLIRLKKRSFSKKDLMIICLGVYGFIMYNTGFRGIWAAPFEMALQPEKVLLFFLIEVFLLAAIEKKKTLTITLKAQAPIRWYHRDEWKIYAANAFMFIFICSSIGYSIQRYNHRFFAFKFVRDKILGKDTEHLKPLANEETRAVNVKRAEGILVPVQQADELEQIVSFMRNYVEEDEDIFTYPDFGTYNFLSGRRGFGKYPLATFTWFNDRWHEDFLAKFKSSRPRYVILQKEISQNWKDVYLALEPNRKKFRDVMDMITADYKIKAETPLSYIYELK